MNKQRVYILISSIIGMLAAFMPWVSATAFRSVTQSFAGITGDGKISLALFAVACALCFIGNTKEKFEKNFVYGLWAIGGINILIFLIGFSKAGEVAKSVYGFGTISLAHGAYLTFLAALAIVLFSIEQLQLVSKVDGLIQNLKNKKSAPTNEGVIPVSAEEVPHVQEEVVQVQDSVAVEVTNVQEKVEQVVEGAEEVVAQVEETVVSSVENSDAEEVVNESNEA